MAEGVPLVIPEVNPDAMAHIKLGGGGAIIANPNCSTIIALMAVTPLHRVAKVGVGLGVGVGRFGLFVGVGVGGGMRTSVGATG